MAYLENVERIRVAPTVTANGTYVGVPQGTITVYINVLYVTGPDSKRKCNWIKYNNIRYDVSFTGSLSSIYAAVVAFSMQFFASFDQSGSYLRYVVNKTMKDVLIDKFYERSQNGEIFNNPMSSSSDVWSRHTSGPKPSVTYSVSGNYSSKTMRITSGATLAETSDVIEGYDFSRKEAEIVDGTDIAINEAYGKVNSGDYSWAVSLAEGKETLSHVILTIKRLLTLVRNVKSGKFGRLAPKTYRAYLLAKKRYNTSLKQGIVQAAPKLIDFWADAWMEMRFAWRPLLIDIDNAAKLYNEGLEQDLRRTVRSGATIVDQYRKSYEYTVDGLRYVVVSNYDYEVRVRTGILIEIFTGTNASQRLGLQDLVGVVNELIPYSFVLGWFLNYDGLLYHLSPNAGVNPLAAWCSTKSDLRETHTVDVYASDGQLLQSDTYSITKKTSTRAPITSPSFFNLDVDLDHLKLVDLTVMIRNLAK